MMSRVHPTDLVISWIFRVLAIILIVFLINLIAFFVPDSFIADIASFINANILLLIIMSLLFFLGALFWSYGFPVNLATPPAEAFASVFLVTFLINLIELIDNYIDTGIGSLLNSLSYIIYLIVFLLVILFGYLTIFQREKNKIVRRSERRVASV